MVKDIIMFKYLLFLPLVLCFETKNPLNTLNPVDIVQETFDKRKRLDPEILSNIQSVRNVFRSSSVDEVFQSQSNASCSASLTNLALDIKNRYPYALQVFDSWAKPESGFFQGDTEWFGRYTECLDAKNLSLEQQFIPQYCTAKVSYKKTVLPFTIGLCFPDSCNATEIEIFIYTASNATLGSQIGCNEISYPDWEAKDIFALILSSFLLLLVFLSTTYDLFLRYQASKDIEYTKFDEDETKKKSTPHVSNSRQLCLSFSIVENTTNFLDTTQKSGQIHCLHGIRFFSMCWVVLGHSQLFVMTAVSNKIYLVNWTLTHWTHQLVVNATYSVDSFFFLSGLLVAYLGMKEVERRHGKINVLLMYVMRYMRLTPTYAYIVFFSITLWMKMGEGPMFYFSAAGMESTCSKYWWTNFLYINNFYPSSMGDECYGVSWYLANDMQFYILSPIFMYLLYKFPTFGKITISVVIVVSSLITGVLSTITEQQPMVISLSQAVTNQNQLLDGKKHYSDYVTDLYAKPWCRIGAYLIGFLSGYILHKCRKSKLKLSKIAVAAGWTLSTAIALAILFGLYPVFKDGGELRVSVAAFYNAVSRPLWTVVMSWIVIACVSGYGGPVDKLLSWKFFMPLSRLTYTSYLVHPMVLFYTYTSRETELHIDMYSMAILYMGQLGLTFMFAFIVSMVVEVPFGVLVKIFAKTVVSTAPPAAVSNDNVVIRSGKSATASDQIYAIANRDNSSEI